MKLRTLSLLLAVAAGAAVAVVAVVSTGGTAQPADSEPGMVELLPSIPAPAAVPVGAEDAFGAALAESDENPTQLSGAYIDAVTGHLTIAGVDADAVATARAHALQAIAPSVLDVDTVLVSRSQSDLSAVNESVFSSTGYDGKTLVGSVADYGHNRNIIIVTAATPTVRRDLFNLYGNAVAVVEGPLAYSDVSGVAAPRYETTDAAYRC